MSFSADLSELIANANDPLLESVWPRVALGSLTRVINGYPFDSSYFDERSGVPLIRIRDVTAGKTQTFYRGPPIQGYLVRDGDLLVGMDGDFNVRLWTGGQGLLNQRVCRIEPGPLVDIRYLALMLPGYLQAINKATHSVTVKHLSSKTIQQIPLPLPPLAEQHRIVAKIDALTARSKRARAELAAARRSIERQRDAVFSAAFSGQLTADMRKVRDVEGELPAGWTWSTVAELSEVQGGLTLGKKRTGNERLIETPYLRVANVQRGWLRLDVVKTVPATPEEIGRLRLMAGDILLNEGGDRDKLGRGWVWNDEVPGCIHQNHVFRLRLRKASVPPKYLSHYANQFGQGYFLDQGKQTTNLASISKAKVCALPIPLPPEAEAAAIVARIETAFAALDRVEAEAKAAERALDRLDQAILSKAFRGELVPQDPADEPASALLARIAAERATAPAPACGRRKASAA